MNVEIGAEAAQFPEKEYINGIAVAVYGAQADVPCGEREELPAAGEPLQGHPTREHRHQGGEDLQVVPALID
jgi:hypothetical protein